MKKKIDIFFWFIVSLLPILVYFIVSFRSASPVAFLIFLNDYSFPFITSSINSIWNLAFNSDCPLAGLVSYFVLVEVVHCMFDVMVFIPRLAHFLVDKGLNFVGGDK